MPLFQDPRTGEGVRIDPAAKQRKPHFDRTQLRTLRARTFEVYTRLGLSLRQIGECFDISKTTVAADIAFLAAQRDLHGPAAILPGIDF